MQPQPKPSPLTHEPAVPRPIVAHPIKFLGHMEHDTVEHPSTPPGTRAEPDSATPEPCAPVRDAVGVETQDAVTSRTADVFGTTDQGMVRTRNEDAFLVARLALTTEVQQGAPEQLSRDVEATAEAWLLVVADGIGGHPGGDMASRVAIGCMADHMARSTALMSADQQAARAQVFADLEEAMAACQRRVEQEAEASGIGGHPGTTLTVACVKWPDLYLAHAGDSRCYLFRHRGLTQLSHDQTLAAALGRERDGSGLDHVLSNAVGGGDDPVEVERTHQTLERGDTLLLCSDGVTGHLDDADLSSYLAALADGNIASARTCVEDMITAVNLRGGTDNATAVVARF